MGIILVALTIFAASLLTAICMYASKNNKADFWFPFLIGIFVVYIFFALSVPHNCKITRDEFVEALGAKAYIESQATLTPDNLNNISEAFATIKAYNEQRESIYERSKGIWSNTFMDTKSLAEFPEVTIDSLYVTNYERKVSPDDAE